MGLDMYLIRKKHIGKAQIQVLSNEYGWIKNIDKEYNDVTRIEEEVGYWRKANQIHKWFVDNIQDGIDDCKEYYVPEEKLKELLDICKEIKTKCKLRKGKVKNGKTLKDGEWVDIIEERKIMTHKKIAEELLPTSSGFFFGGTDYDEWYMKEIDYTIETLTRVLEEFKDGYCGTLYYHSSW